MELLAYITYFNHLLALPATILFFGTGVLLTLKTGFLQFRAFPRFIRLIYHGVAQRKDKHGATINPFHALFTAMGTTIGTGNVVGPSIAIVAGGPGALFWLLIYIFFGSVTKFAEVTFAVATRTKLSTGHIVGGPMEYLKLVQPLLAHWYVLGMIVLMAGFSAAQSNTLAQVFAQEAVPSWVVGLTLAIIVLVVLQGGAQRVGATASKLVPLMFVLYVTFALMILFKDITALKAALALVMHNIFTPAAAAGGFAGATVFAAMRAGIFKAIFITEAGIGTSAIPQAVSDVQRPSDQGVLALFSMLSDAFLCTISGLLVLVTGVWMSGTFKSTLVYEAFQMNSSDFGRIVLLISISLFVITTVIGNSFNGVQSFTSLTKDKGMYAYIFFTMAVIFFASMMKVALVWELMDTLVTLVAIPNLIGLLILAFKKPEILKS